MHIIPLIFIAAGISIGILTIFYHPEAEGRTSPPVQRNDETIPLLQPKIRQRPPPIAIASDIRTTQCLSEEEGWDMV